MNEQKDIPVPVTEKTECALGIGSTCISDKSIKKIANDEGVDINKACPLQELKNKFKCDSQKCVLEKSSLSRKEKNDESKRFKPTGPANSDKLLHNGNIDTVLNRLTIPYPKFYHMNFQMIDFAGEKDSNGNWVQKGSYVIKPTELGNIDIVKDVIDVIGDDGEKKYDTFGVVLNTDTREKGGEHWFCLFCDFRDTEYTIEYFNSSGRKPYRQIQDWIIKTRVQIENKYNVKIIESSTQHQKDSQTECGPYTLYYIYNRLKRVSPETINKKRIPDADMLTFRAMCFTEE